MNRKKEQGKYGRKERRIQDKNKIGWHSRRIEGKEKGRVLIIC